MTDFRHAARRGLDRLILDGDGDVLARDAVCHVSAPVERIDGRDAILAGLVAPLRQALSGAHRRDLLVIGGDNTLPPGGRWVACVTHIVGNHVGTLWGVAPSGKLAFLRAGEFHRIGEDGRVVESRIIFDLPDLMRQAGRDPWNGHGLSTEIAFPAPATQDGLCPDPAGGGESLALIERMLGNLTEYDPETKGSPGQTGEGGTWADDMMWYGPCGIGSNHRWEGFVKDHRAPFLDAFPDRRGGDHYSHIGDGAYAAVSGWPSMRMTHRGPYLGIPATDRALSLRVMDFYRTANGRIAENWVFLDYVDMFAQMGHRILR
jgi:predicted ester cyclase